MAKKSTRSNVVKPTAKSDPNEIFTRPPSNELSRLVTRERLKSAGLLTRNAGSDRDLQALLERVRKAVEPDESAPKFDETLVRKIAGV